MLKHGYMIEYISSVQPISWMYDRRCIQHNIYIYIYITMEIRENIYYVNNEKYKKPYTINMKENKATKEN